MDSSQSANQTWFIDKVLPHEQDLRRWLSVRFSAIRDVDDLVQETFSRTITAHQSGPIVNPRAFLFVTARNLALNQLRHYKYESPPLEEPSRPLSIVDEINCPMETVARQEELQQLKNAIQSLPDRCREIITLRKIYGMSQKEIAEELGISISTVKGQVSIGMHKCVQYFRKTGFLERYRS
jgi:RNA polymerase sigma-70 factor (ECF subfamily)